eukprot:SAG11_NODE_857_length_6851_cov_2.438981_1_plen_50_part_10
MHRLAAVFRQPFVREGVVHGIEKIGADKSFAQVRTGLVPQRLCCDPAPT